jgi:threonyl-tRNA synthetase
VTAAAVSFRFRDGTQVNAVPVAAAVDAIASWVTERRNDPPTAEAFAHLRPPADGANG